MNKKYIIKSQPITEQLTPGDNVFSINTQQFETVLSVINDTIIKTTWKKNDPNTEKHSHDHHIFNLKKFYLYNTEDNEFLGEISPDATWIKDGDLIDEYDTFMFYKTKYGWSSEHPWDETLLEKKYFKVILGPCNHFH